MERKCTSEASGTVSTSARCKDPRAKITSTMNHHQNSYSEPKYRLFKGPFLRSNALRCLELLAPLSVIYVTEA
jgi:hypothetical protein